MTALFFIDFFKAFNTVNTNIFVQLLECFVLGKGSERLLFCNSIYSSISLNLELRVSVESDRVV